MATTSASVEYVDTKRAAEFLGLAPGTLQNQRSLRTGPPYIRLSPKPMFPFTLTAKRLKFQ